MNAGTAVVPDECAEAAAGTPLGREGVCGLSTRQGSLVLDLGCGNGVFLSALAAREPDCHCLGIEKKDYRVRQAQRRSSALPNARVVKGEVEEMLVQLPPGCVARAYLLFNDPWPKRRHALRRIVQKEFVQLLASRLVPGGSCYFASDSEAYFAWSHRIFARSGWAVSDWLVPRDWPQTEFEQHFLERGVDVHRFCAIWK
jgi:tRNA (guanine-N7-)-methyltransferase